jgi:hypothetical protein
MNKSKNVFLELKSKKMKKVVLAAVVLGTLSMVSCRKEWTCECTSVYTDTDSGISATSVESTTLNKLKPSQVDAVCNSLGAAESTPTSSLVRTCEVTGLD